MRPDDATPRPGARRSRPRRRFAQNFLTDRGAARRIVEEVAAGSPTAVVEIGPGRGSLTRGLVARFGRIAAVEVDRDLAAHLRRSFPSGRLALIEGDILRVSFDEVAARLELPPGAALTVVGNLPYNISKPVADKLVKERSRVERAVLTFQSEVADRLCARPGSRAYGPLTVLVGRAYRIEARFDLPPSAFRPRPAVTSTVTAWERRDLSGLPPELEARLRACLAACFRRRRGTLRNNLRAFLPGGEGEADELLRRAGLDGGVRPERVPPDGFLRMARIWPVEQAGS